MKKILVTGAAGFVGRHMVRCLEDRGFECVGLTHSRMEITDIDAIRDGIAGIRPDIVVHCAAISSTAYAREHPEESMAVNVAGPLNLALACRECGAGLYVMSSDQVYGGCTLDGPIAEDRSLSPNNIYGQHKLLMEEKVLEAMPSAIALRLTWMYENYDPAAPHTDIISRLVQAIEGNLPIKASVREWRGMTPVDLVCSNIAGSFGKLPGGVYNFGCGNLLDSCTTLRDTLRSAGLRDELVVPDDSWGRNLSMDCTKIAGLGITFPKTADALQEALAQERL